MKIGILTMVYRHNYGGILQCVALQNVLKSWGHDVEVIQFKTKQRASFRRRLHLLCTDFKFDVYVSWVKDKCSDVFNCLLNKRRSLPKSLLENCGKFIQDNINYTEFCDESTIGTLVEKQGFEVIIVGSDKIWGSLGYEQLVYFGDWFPKFEGKLISYAACSSQSNVPKYNHQKVEELLSHFTAISVRDRHTWNVIRPFIKTEPQIVVDPTVLYDFTEYISPYEGGEYIFAYILGREIKGGGHAKILAQIKNKYGNIPVKAIVLSDESLGIVPYADEVIYDADPGVWLNSLAHASFVYTDSFHGILFSLKFRKPFVAYYKEYSRASRLIDLKERWGLNDFIVDSADKIDMDQCLDYQNILPFIKAEKESSLSYLKNNL